jgi:hypothetical protein
LIHLFPTAGLAYLTDAALINHQAIAVSISLSYTAQKEIKLTHVVVSHSQEVTGAVAGVRGQDCAALARGVSAQSEGLRGVSLLLTVPFSVHHRQHYVMRFLDFHLLARGVGAGARCADGTLRES